MPNFHNDRIDHPTPLRATDLLSHLAASYLEPDDHKWMDSALGRQSSVAAILKEYKIVSADVRINCDATPDELIDVCA